MAAYEREEAERIAREKAEAKARADEEMRNRIRKNIGNSGMTERSLRQTFDSFTVTKDNKRAHAVCIAYAQDFNKKLPRRGGPEMGRNGLLITGKCGTGKTHLANAIANSVLATGTPVISMTAIELLSKIKRTYADNAGGIGEDDVLKTYTKAALLVLDDLGKERSSEWVASMLYAIIDRRYNAMMPIIVTTNYAEDELIERLTPTGSPDRMTAMATLDRLAEMCKAVPLVGESWRRK